MQVTERCRLSDDPLELVLDLGQQPLGNGFMDSINQAEFRYTLQCGFAPTSKLFQLISQPEPELMFHGKYAFMSETSEHMSSHFEQMFTHVVGRKVLSADSFVVEIGSNDGILLKHFAAHQIPHLGVEPAEYVANIAKNKGIRVLNKFFSKEIAAQIHEDYGAADVVLAANVLCHIPSILDLASGIKTMLKADGILIFEDPYLGDVIRLGSYDQIYDEHVFLFSALSVTEIFKRVGMELIDVSHQTTHGGSMRYTLARTGAYSPNPSVSALISSELALGLDDARTFMVFSDRVKESGKKLRQTLEDLRSAGKRVAAYGATSKSTTIYNFAGIGADLISVIYDNSPTKIGRYSPGVHIPIVSESEFASDAPDVTFLAAWNHQQEILGKHQRYGIDGGRWITHVPQVRFL